MVTSYMSYDATYAVYDKEKIDNNKDNIVLLKAINDKTTQNNQLSSMINEMRQQNKLLKEQNIYLKTMTQDNDVPKITQKVNK